MQVLTANRLRDGLVVFLDRHDAWVEHILDARVLNGGEEAEAAETVGRDAVAERDVVEPYLIDVRPAATGVTPTRLREKIRAEGPTVRRDLGKQAEAALDARLVTAA
jgi:hypothetical protein